MPCTAPSRSFRKEGKAYGDSMAWPMLQGWREAGSQGQKEGLPQVS